MKKLKTLTPSNTQVKSKYLFTLVILGMSFFTSPTAKANSSSDESTAAPKVAPSRGLDILMVVDNSGSMSEEQLNLSNAGIYPLLAYLPNINWNLSVITTDSPCSHPALTNQSPNLQNSYKSMVTVGTSGSSNEMPLKMTKEVVDNIKNPHIGTPFNCPPPKLSPQTNDLAIIYLSDENEYLSPLGAPHIGSTAKELILALETAGYTPGVNVRAYGFITQLSSKCFIPDEPSNEILALIKSTDGLWQDYCAMDYKTSLIGFSHDISKMVAP